MLVGNSQAWLMLYAYIRLRIMDLYLPLELKDLVVWNNVCFMGETKNTNIHSIHGLFRIQKQRKRWHTINDVCSYYKRQ